MDLPPWATKAIDKILSHELGGIGISDLKSLGWALQVRWLWLQKTEPYKPWSPLRSQTSSCVQSLFSMAVISEIGDDKNILFWKEVAAWATY